MKKLIYSLTVSLLSLEFLGGAYLIFEMLRPVPWQTPENQALTLRVGVLFSIPIAIWMLFVAFAVHLILKKKKAGWGWAFFLTALPILLCMRVVPVIGVTEGAGPIVLGTVVFLILEEILLAVSLAHTFPKPQIVDKNSRRQE